MPPKAEPHELSRDEIREEVARQIWRIVDYWESKFPADVPLRRRLSGVAFSILVMLDGGVPDIPGFIVKPDPHPDSREWHKMRGENWYPDGPEAERPDITGELHGDFISSDPKGL